MPRWKALPEELDPQVREFTEQLRWIVDRSGRGLAAIADDTGYSKSSWERYLNGRLLPPRGATQALADVTGTEVRHLATMWELAERAWSRSEMRHDMTMEAIQVAQARAALGESGDTPARGRRWAPGRGRDRAGQRPPVGGAPESGGAVAPAPGSSPVPSPVHPPSPSPSPPSRSAQPETDDRTTVIRRQRPSGAGTPSGSAAPGSETARPQPPVPPAPGPAAPAVPAGTDPGHTAHPASGPQAPRVTRAPGGAEGRRRIAMAFAGVAGALVVIAAAAFAFDLTGDDSVAAHPPTPSTDTPELPAGVDCAGKDCAGKDPEVMGCGGQHATTVGSGWVGTGLVEVRYSEVCGAAWGRVTGGGQGDSLKISSGKSSQTRKVGEDDDAYTPMVPAGSATAARACLTSSAEDAAAGESCVKGGDTPPTAPGDAG